MRERTRRSELFFWRRLFPEKRKKKKGAFADANDGREKNASFFCSAFYPRASTPFRPPRDFGTTPLGASRRALSVEVGCLIEKGTEVECAGRDIGPNLFDREEKMTWTSFFFASFDFFFCSLLGRAFSRPLFLCLSFVVQEQNEGLRQSIGRGVTRHFWKRSGVEKKDEEEAA